jgi:AcrR family transcriptional regulator
MTETSRSMRGRAAEAARNDQKILESARAVFVADPGAPISAVAKHAGVGIGALYHRYESKEVLLQTLAATSLQRYTHTVEAALADNGDPWQAFVTFMHDVVDTDTQSLAQRLAGTFTPTPELQQAADYGQKLNVALFERTINAGALRKDFTVGDMSLILEMVMAIRLADAGRTRRLRHRYLSLLLDAVHLVDGDPLPGPPPSWQELAERWQRKPQKGA